MFKKKKVNRFLLVLILISLAVSPAFALGAGNRNLLLIGVMSVCPLIFISFNKFYRSDIKLYLFMIGVVFIPFLFNTESMRWTTVMYSLMFGFTFLAYKQLLYKGVFGLPDYLKFLKFILYAYTIVLIIQQVCVLTGLPIFNISNYDVREPFKLNSLAAEPSHSARIVTLLMYSYITIKEMIFNEKYNFKDNLKEDKRVWLAFFWTMLTMGSATAIIFIGIVLLKFINIKRFLPIAVLFVVLISVVDFSEVKAVNRASKVFVATLMLDTDEILEADHSAAMRIVPMIFVAQKSGITTMKGWFGHGIDFTSTFLSDVIPGVPRGFSGGGLFQVWLEYGFIVFVLFVLFSLSVTFRKEEIFSLIFWFFLVFMYGINNQIVWLTIIILFTNNFFYRKKNSYENQG